MSRDDCVDLFRRIPERFHPQVNIVMTNQNMVTVDVVVRFEPTFVVLRGREGGSTDEGRAFFIPYGEISYLRIERSMKLADLKKMFGETDYVDTEDRLGQDAEKEAEEKASPSDVETPGPNALTTAPQDPAAIAKQNLLDRIRAARANVAGVTGKLK